VDSVESAGGRLGAVLSSGSSGAFALGRHGPWVAGSPALARQVLTDPSRFDFPSDVSRTGNLSASRADTRSGHLTFASLTPPQVEVGRETFAREWADAVRAHDRTTPHEPYDAMVLLRRPVARATTAAALPALDDAARDVVADAVLRWIDALGPVIAAPRPPHRWSRVRRAEQAARLALEETLDQLPVTRSASEESTFLAAGIQVPIAAGAWLLAMLADHPTGVVEPMHAVWETLRIAPPTWITARITVEEVILADTRIPRGSVVLVSPLLLGRQAELVPGDPDDLVSFDPDRWHDETRRPGAWLPFGAGPHACPGRTLGIALLLEIAQWGLAHELHLSERVRVDQTRGIAPLPCRFSAVPRRETSP
jgi:cytochrome P450